MGEGDAYTYVHKVDSDVYHAWNEVYLNGQWHTIDATLDCEYVALDYGYGNHYFFCSIIYICNRFLLQMEASIEYTYCIRLWV